MFRPLFGGSDKFLQNPYQIALKISLQKWRQFHRRASAGAQGEQVVIVRKISYVNSVPSVNANSDCPLANLHYHSQGGPSKAHLRPDRHLGALDTSVRKISLLKLCVLWHFASGNATLLEIVTTIRKKSISVDFCQKNSRRRWRSQRRKSSSVPAGAANFPAAVFLAGKCPNLGRDSISRCRKIGESFSSSVEICRKTFPAGNFGQPQPSRVFWFCQVH